MLQHCLFAICLGGVICVRCLFDSLTIKHMVVFVGPVLRAFLFPPVCDFCLFKMASTWVISTLPKIVSSLSTQHSKFKSHFSVLATNEDRVQFCLGEKSIQRWVGRFVSQFGSNQNGLKCSKTSAKHREKGNDYFQAKNYQQAIELYNAAIRFAPQNVDSTSELAFAYGNRSAAYFQIDQHENALKDIDAALALGYGRFKPVTKLQLRKADCLIRLGRASEASELLLFIQKPTEDLDKSYSNRWIELYDQIKLLGDKKTAEAKIPLIEKLTQNGLFMSNEKMPSISTKVAVCYDAEKGRHFVAQEDIQFGDIVAVSRPYVAVFGSKEDAIKCHHCCRDFFQEDMNVAVSLRPIPCASCSSVMFCSEECRTESSNSYHRYECGQHDLLVQFSESYRMPLRVLYRAGMDQVRLVVSGEQEKDSSYFSEQPEDHYSHVYHLVHHSDGQLKYLDISYMKMLESSLVACILFQLAKLGHFPMNTKEEEKLIGGLLLRHLHQLRYNVVEHRPLDKVTLPSLPPLFDLYPMYASTLNHSCHANARLELLTNEGVCLLQAAQPISTGTEIVISYLNDIIQEYKGTHTSTSPNQEIKRSDLLSRYGFHCNCAQCKYHIRNMPSGAVEYVPLSCRDCGHLMENFSEQMSESKVLRCTKCPLEMSNSELKKRYRKHYEDRSMIDQLVQQVIYSQVAEQFLLFGLLESALERMESSIHRDSTMLTAIVHSMMGLFYLSHLQFGKWWAGIERYLSVVEHLFGAESTQFIIEFDNIYKLQVQPIAQDDPMMMTDFQQQDSQMYERYLARVEQWKQLKLKYYAGY